MGAEVQWQHGEQADKGSSRLGDIVAIPPEDESVPVLADRTEFTLNPEDWEAWEALHDRPARDLPELRELMAEPSSFFVD